MVYVRWILVCCMVDFFIAVLPSGHLGGSSYINFGIKKDKTENVELLGRARADARFAPSNVLEGRACVWLPRIPG